MTRFCKPLKTLTTCVQLLRMPTTLVYLQTPTNDGRNEAKTNTLAVSISLWFCSVYLVMSLRITCTISLSRHYLRPTSNNSNARKCSLPPTALLTHVGLDHSVGVRAAVRSWLSTLKCYYNHVYRRRTESVRVIGARLGSHRSGNQDGVPSAFVESASGQGKLS